MVMICYIITEAETDVVLLSALLAPANSSGPLVRPGHTAPSG